MSRLLADTFKLDPGKMGERGHRDTILIDLYSSILAFARDARFSLRQTSVIFSIVKDLHDTTTRMFGNFHLCAARHLCALTCLIPSIQWLT